MRIMHMRQRQPLGIVTGIAWNHVLIVAYIGRLLRLNKLAG